MATQSQYPEDSREQLTESDVVCDQCGKLMWQTGWWDDPPHLGGACIGTKYECGDCGKHRYELTTHQRTLTQYPPGDTR